MSNEIEEFYKIINNLKFTQRQGWLGRGLNADTMASHIYGAMAIGWIMAEKEGGDRNRVTQLLLVHDLVMAKMDDVSPTIGKYTGKYDEKEAMEMEANEMVIEMLPKEIREEYKHLFGEYNNKATKESVIANEANKLETLLQGEAYEAENGKSDILDEFLVTYKDLFTTAIGKSLFEGIKERHDLRKKIL